ncbi:MAG: hypothetical protein Q4B91_04605 [Atopobiaceae bacterium]|nr:hypothetical protein [Atopobiaceae bacterium]
MGAPLVIGISGGARDREVASALLRTILDDERPYERAALVGGRELFDGVEWSHHPDRMSELQRIDVHMRHASEKDLAYAIVELDEAERDAVRSDLLCVIGVGGAGTATTADGRSLSFSARGSLADVGVGRTESHYGYVQFLAHTPSREMTLAVPLTGRFNLGPALAVVTVCELLDIAAGQIGIGLLGARASGHGELLAAPDRGVYALVEESGEARDAELLVAAAREDYATMRVEAVRGPSAVATAVARAYGRDGDAPTLLVLLGAPGDELEDAFQAAVRAHALLP